MKQRFTYLLIVVMSIISIPTFAHDIEVANCDGVSIYYDYYDDGKKLSVTYRGGSEIDYPDRYTGKVVIPESVTYQGQTYAVVDIDNYAFSGCAGLTSVTLPNSLMRIGDSAFWECSSLTSITIPSGVSYISDTAFRWCSSLENIIVESGNTKFDSRDNCNAIIETAKDELYIGCKNSTIPNSIKSIRLCAFESCFGLTSIVIGNGVTSIGERAFYCCDDLTWVTIGSSVTSIGKMAFRSCYALTDVYCLAENVPFTQDDAFLSTPLSNATLHVPAASVEAYRSTEPWSGFKDVVALTDEEMGIIAPLNDNGEMINAKWYTIDGRMLQGKPTKKGVYINNGIKVVIK